jgi:Sulfotransferase family
MRNTPFRREPEVSDFSRPSTAAVSADVRSDTPILAEARDLIREVVARVRRNCVREIWDWVCCKRVTPPSVQQLGESIGALDTSAHEEDDVESPIFLLATGWRSGSTLLQRVLVTDPRVLLWGEPLGEMALVSVIAETLSRLSTFPGLSERCNGKNGPLSSLATSWIATLYPPGRDLRLGLRALFDRWLGEPARNRGFERWGFKEVRLGATEASLLLWLYPRAKFVLLSRNPYDCYRSLSDSGWHHLYYSRPGVRMDSAAGLARHWNRIALSWSDLPSSFPARRIKYEDLIGGRVDFRTLEAWLGVKLNEQVALSVSVGSTARRRGPRLCERWIISHEAAAGMRALGY